MRDIEAKNFRGVEIATWGVFCENVMKWISVLV